ncbi:Eukaryotic aspartyl protease family protein [Rhynchospora pubera]|uniref:Eukaryotic aspartyl protease family protein n=1 Tax=Rhynchospora pubera TaxID=906938 RepID=A0AAV8D5H9_9POAL|nr:Eukaryotic aspartyl protease family protein [Rhynchospora pubera]
MAYLGLLASVLTLICVAQSSESATLSLRLVHRFSDEARVSAPGGAGWRWPSRGSMAYYRTLLRSDLQRQKRRLGVRYQHQALFPDEGSDTFSLGNDFGWLHYTWIDIGTPNVSFLVALDSGSDLLWVPCDCIQCAPLSGYHSSLDKDLGMYNPAESSTSRHLPCSHELCQLGSSCKADKQPCPYNISYYTENTYSSGLLVEDKMYLTSSDGRGSIQASVIIGCGRRQGGGYLEGMAPDGLLGLGLGEISVPSFLSKVGLVKNSFSICFKEDNSGHIYFGDEGVPSQKSTPFVALDGKYIYYIIEVDRCCVGHKCLEQSGLQALFDTGSSFTFVPQDIYKRVSLEFDKQVNASRADFDGYPFEYCYKSSPVAMPDIPNLTLTFAVNKSFLVVDPIFNAYGEQGQLAGFCLALQPTTDILATIGQNFMTGYHIAFDRENLKLGWSRTDCGDLGSSTKVPLTPEKQPNRPENPLPTNEQQSSPGHAVSPAEAGRAPTGHNSSAVSQKEPFLHVCLLLLLMTQFTVFSVG